MNHHNIALQLGAFGLATTHEAVQIAQSFGVGAVSFSGAPVPIVAGKPLYSFLWDELDAARQDEIRTVRRAFARGVIHAPFVDTPLVSSNLYIERESHRQMHMAISAASALELEAVTVHAGLPAKNMTAGEFRYRLITVLQSLGEVAAAANTRVCLENWRYPCNPTEHLALLEAVDHPNVCATLDIGHISYWFQDEGIKGLHSAAEMNEYHQRLYGFIDTLGQRIAHVHMHDVRAVDLVDHRGLGRGFLDIENIVAALHRVAFEGVILFEIAEADFAVAAKESVQRLQQAMRQMEPHPNPPQVGEGTVVAGATLTHHRTSSL